MPDKNSKVEHDVLYRHSTRLKLGVRAIWHVFLTNESHHRYIVSMLFLVTNKTAGTCKFPLCTGIKVTMTRKPKSASKRVSDFVYKRAPYIVSTCWREDDSLQTFRLSRLVVPVQVNKPRVTAEGDRTLGHRSSIIFIIICKDSSISAFFW